MGGGVNRRRKSLGKGGAKTTRTIKNEPREKIMPDFQVLGITKVMSLKNVVGKIKWKIKRSNSLNI